MTTDHTGAAAARDAAQREHVIADRQAELAEIERRASDVAPTQWQRTAHRLASEVHADAAASHERGARLRELEAEVDERGLA